MLKSLFFTSLVCLALGGGALSSPYPEDTIDTNEIVAFGEDSKLLPIGSISGLDFSSNSLFYDNDRGIIYFENTAPIVNKGLVLTDHSYGESPGPIRVAMYITTIPFYNSVMRGEGGGFFYNAHSEVLFLHLVFSSIDTDLHSTAMISIPLGFRASESNNLPVNWWLNGINGLIDNYQVFFKAKQTNAVSLSFSYNPSYTTLTIHSKLYYNEDGVTYVHSSINDIWLDSSGFVKFFGNAEGRVARYSDWYNNMLEMSMLELTSFSLNRVPIRSVGSNYLMGYEDGYDDGLNQNINNGGLFNVFTSMFAGLSSFLAISLFPGVTIGGIALIFLVIPLTYGIIKLMRGGGG